MLINRLHLLINQDLLLEGNIERFTEKYRLTIAELDIHKPNLELLLEEISGKEFQALFRELDSFIVKIQLLVDNLK